MSTWLAFVFALTTLSAATEEPTSMSVSMYRLPRKYRCVSLRDRICAYNTISCHIISGHIISSGRSINVKSKAGRQNHRTKKDRSIALYFQVYPNVELSCANVDHHDRVIHILARLLHTVRLLQSLSNLRVALVDSLSNSPTALHDRRHHLTKSKTKNRSVENMASQGVCGRVVEVR